MKNLCIVAVWLLLSVFLVSTASAAPKGAPQKPRQAGIQNAKKAMKAKLERDKKMHEVRKKGQLQKRELQSQG